MGVGGHRDARRGGLTTVDEGGVVELSVVDAATRERVPCRIHLADAEGTPIAPGDCPAWVDHFVCAGRAAVRLAPGTYRYRVERGPEWRTLEGAFTVQEGDRTVRLELDRVVDLAAEGWWAGDLHVHRAPSDEALLASAEGLFVAPPVTWWTIEDPLLAGVEPSPVAGEDERPEGGALLYFGLEAPLTLKGATSDRPPSSAVLAAAREYQGVHVDAEKPTWWDVPLWLARGIDSVGLATNHLWPVGGVEGEAWGRPRDVAAWPAPHGTGLWTQELYYRILESGSGWRLRRAAPRA